MLKGAAGRLEPTFLVIGAQKAGTTALFSYLSRHPGIYPPSRKEIDYFWVDSLYARGEVWYLSQFPMAPQGSGEAVTFEATPHYLACRRAPRRIRRFAPGMKLIALLREPIARAYSQYRHYLRKTGDRAALAAAASRYDEPVRGFYRDLQDDPARLGSFESEVARELESPSTATRFLPGYVAQGFYDVQIERYLGSFSRRQMLILDSSELRRSRVETLDRVVEFLDLEPVDWSSLSLPDENVGGYDTTVPPATAARLAAVFRPHNERLFSLLGRRFPGWS